LRYREEIIEMGELDDDLEAFNPIITCNGCGKRMLISEWNGPHIDEEHGGDPNITNTCSDEDKERAAKLLKRLQDEGKYIFFNAKGEEVRV
jgi:hypothetical protein